MQPHPNGPITLVYISAATDAADNLFKAIGFDYFGPFDGHDVNN